MGEHYVDRKVGGNDEEEVIERTYYYTKDWFSHRIPSITFNQPFKHNNPMRDPFPSHHWEAESAKFGDYTIDSDIIHSIATVYPKYWDVNDISVFSQSSAAQGENFNYIGEGYFYSPYEESGGHTVAKLAGQFLEGSLFDVQLVDFFPQCTAGDIRVHYTVSEPQEGSVLGMLKDGQGSLGGWTSSRGYMVALFEEGL